MMGDFAVEMIRFDPELEIEDNEPALTSDTPMFFMGIKRFIPSGPVCFIGVFCEFLSQV